MRDMSGMRGHRTGRGGPAGRKHREFRANRERRESREQRVHRVIGGRPAGLDPPERGAVTAEFATALPAIVLVLVFGLTGISAGITQLRLEEAARAAAREVMRADTTAAEAAVQRLAGGSAQLVLTRDGEWTVVEVRSSLSLPVLSLLPLELSADAVAFPGDGGYPVGTPAR